MAIKRNEVVFNSQPQPQPQNENKLAKFLASIGKFVETPEGQQTATNLASAIPLLFGRSDIASGIVGAGQQAYDRQMQQQKAQQDQAFRNLQMQLAQSQQDIDNQRQNLEFDYKRNQDARELAINQGRLDLGIETLNNKNKQDAISNELEKGRLGLGRDRLDWDKTKSELGVGLKGTGTKDKKNANWEPFNSAIANVIPPNLRRTDENGNMLVDTSNVGNHQVNLVEFDENGRMFPRTVFTNTPDQAKKLAEISNGAKGFVDVLDRAMVLRAEYGKEFINGLGGVKSKYQSLQSQMGLRLKTLEGLGVISDSDYKNFIENIIPDLNQLFSEPVFSKLETYRQTAINQLNIAKEAYVYDPAKDPLNQFAIQSQSQSQSNFSPVVLQSGAKIIGVE